MKKFYNGFKKVADWYSNSVFVVACIFVLCLVFFTTYEVIVRHFFNSPTIWTFEVDGYLYIAICVLGLGFAERQDKHMSMDFISGHLHGRSLVVLKLVLAIFGLIYAVMLVAFGWKYAYVSFAKGTKSSSVLAAPLWPSQFAIPIGFFGAALQYLVKIIDCVLILTGKADVPESTDKPTA